MMRSDEIIKILERNLRFYIMRFASLDNIVRDINSEIRRYVSDCYYYVAEETIVENETEIENIRAMVERANDDVRCRVNDHEVCIAYIKMRRAVIELPGGRQFWLIMSYEINKAEETQEETQAKNETLSTPAPKCQKFGYRYTSRTGARTQYYLIDADTWVVLEPTRRESSKAGARGSDVYCLSEDKWNRVIVVKLERSNSGKLSYEVIAPPGLEKYARELEEILATCGDFREMEETVERYVEARRLSRGG